jgi:hypothetical protein
MRPQVLEKEVGRPTPPPVHIVKPKVITQEDDDDTEPETSDTEEKFTKSK